MNFKKISETVIEFNGIVCEKITNNDYDVDPCEVCCFSHIDDCPILECGNVGDDYFVIIEIKEIKNETLNR